MLEYLSWEALMDDMERYIHNHNEYPYFRDIGFDSISIWWAQVCAEDGDVNIRIAKNTEEKQQEMLDAWNEMAISGDYEKTDAIDSVAWLIDEYTYGHSFWG